MGDLIVSRRFCGPADSGNGGWTAGALATLDTDDCPDNRCESWPPIEVTLRQPPPLDTTMTVTTSDDGVTEATFGGVVIATAQHSDASLLEVEPVFPEDARSAEAGYPGHDFHPFPTCFVCGTDREEGDGLRIFPGPVGDDRAAATWTPH